MGQYTNKNMVIAATYCEISKCEGCPFEYFLDHMRKEKCREILIARLGIALSDYIKFAEQLDSNLGDTLEKLKELKKQ